MMAAIFLLVSIILLKGILARNDGRASERDSVKRFWKRLFTWESSSRMLFFLRK